MKKRVGIWLGITAMAIGAPITYFVTHDNTSWEKTVGAKNVKKMSDAEQTTFLNRLADMVGEGKKPSEIEATLSENIAKLGKERANEAFYSFKYSLAIEQEKQMDGYRNVAENLLVSYNNKEFKAGKGESYKNVKDLAVRGYLEELDRQFLYLEDDGESLNLKIDYNRLNKKYEPFFDDGLKTLMGLYIQDEKSPYVNTSRTDYDLKKMLERILFIEGKKEVWMNTMYHDEMMAIQSNIYADFFGFTHDAYFEKKDGGMVMKESVKDEMWALMKEYSNSFMGNDIFAYMDNMETNKWMRKDDDRLISKLMYERFNTPSKVQAPFATVTAPVNDSVEGVDAE